MKRLDEEGLRKFPGLESLTNDEAQKVIADLHILSEILIQTLIKMRRNLMAPVQKLSNRKMHIINYLNRKESDSVDQLKRTLSNH